jgi:hypothetical protein
MDKTCTKCGQLKNSDHFGKDSKAKDGKFNWCRDCVCKHSSLYYHANKKKCRAKSLEIYHRNINNDDFRKRRNARQSLFAIEYVKRPEVKKRLSLEHKKRCLNVSFRIGRRLSFQVWYSLRLVIDKSQKKNGRHWEDLVGWTLGQLMEHLESKFQNGMTRDNYGGKNGWQIDHVIPRTWFSIKDTGSEGFKECWELSNLQPKWSKDNASKGNRYAG